MWIVRLRHRRLSDSLWSVFAGKNIDSFNLKRNGRGGIRTPGTRKGTSVFKSDSLQ